LASCPLEWKMLKPTEVSQCIKFLHGANFREMVHRCTPRAQVAVTHGDA